MKDIAMCSCQQPANAASAAAPSPDEAISVRVEDMSCGHCAGTIKQAIESRLPGAAVVADPVSKLVSVRGSTDLAAIKAAVTAAGYTPSAAPAG
ncbi:heavy-metal-associated domain-containing protein [Bosea sp. CS1GBMeth4]|uniref:heavy-metal-associated domain-containing protein n=1 Tax=Bosea sp. CS1GBMeth4 TaxID=1892849 RepID=UPI001FCEA528|nr:heavy-metal-associated domain-containing protein [Bosea sp. CS1GBMeth4]